MILFQRNKSFFPKIQSSVWKMKTPFFHLKSIVPSKIDTKYNFDVTYTEANRLHHQEQESKLKKTKIVMKDGDKPARESSTYSYFDESKSEIVHQITMLDTIKNQKLPLQTNLKCYWCRHNFSSIPIGCPIDRVFSKLYKTYFSEITKKTYMLNETITAGSGSEDMSKQNNSNYFTMKTQDRNYYITDGIFCSFNCCMAFIKENKNNHLYKQSESLLLKIYDDLFELKTDILPASTWRLLKEYGGDYTIEEFRQNFNTITHICQDEYTTELPTFKSVGFVYRREEKI